MRGDQFVGGAALSRDVEVHNFVSIVLHLGNRRVAFNNNNYFTHFD